MIKNRTLDHGVVLMNTKNNLGSRLLYQAIRHINEADWKIKIVIKTREQILGYAEGDEIGIILSPSMHMESSDNLPSSPAITLLHEIFHLIFPNASEEKIQEFTKIAWFAARPDEQLFLYQILFELS